MVPRENKNSAYAKFGRINKEYYGIFRSGLLYETKYFLLFYIQYIYKTKHAPGPILGASCSKDG